MDNIDKEFIDSLMDAEKIWKRAYYLSYVTYPVVKDGKLILRGLEQVYESLIKLMESILKFESFYKRITVTKDSRRNLEAFFGKLSARYGLSKEDCDVLKKIIFLGRKHKEGGMTFSNKNKAMILDEYMNKSEIREDELKHFISITKKLLDNTNRNFKHLF